ncbi:hypothetical protein EN829_020600 [Mesorhizobium sp. M00.F.Ca.ET.186.01.1.1]|nr:hypothetical protein EN848_28755 [bacterium M00.F.Ca.ET.205.01.1.1]TGU50416.1 hypothetical protein EN795_22645 [bacterium M00.F.Ca.ET.152.01.1.1]TGV33889.1 hypothetical protein EN829_020600 [Mesorhizobium sp. M00.F.Ca.ET.186.01.1.1]TGZ40780.1 hypothetical protein EN805_22040 [bacterium M00.F.Ca.ET.162.01.1.1]
MSDTRSTENIAALGVADWLCLAAAPTFALMALVSLSGEGAMGCLGAPSPIAGMPAMYLLMSAFHLAPWLRVISGRKVRTVRD